MEYNTLMEYPRNIVIIGAGPAGLTSAYELLNESNIIPVVIEESDSIGGLSCTQNYKGNRIDIGGHRFYSNNTIVTRWWEKIMMANEATSQDFLMTKRISRIYFSNKFFSYPITISLSTIRNLGLKNTLLSGLGFMKASLFPRKEITLEDFFINHFGKHLYRLFFEDYTTKVWGKHPSELSSDWGKQRVKGVSLSVVLKHFIKKNVLKTTDTANTETSLIDYFSYPKLGPGQLWERVAEVITKKGALIRVNHKVTKVIVKKNLIQEIEITTNTGEVIRENCDCLLSSMPVKDLVNALEGIAVPDDVFSIANNLPYRDFITVGLLVKKMAIHTNNKLNLLPDTWIYIQEKDVMIGRLQIYNNWSPYMVKDPENTVWLGLEYFCNEGDELWNKSEDEFIHLAKDELVKIGIIEEGSVLDAHQVKVKKAYPAYFGSYNEFEKVKNFLNSIENLYCIGRNGQHRYNNMDHSMLTAIEAVNNIKNHIADKNNIWAINVEKSYHESSSC